MRHLKTAPSDAEPVAAAAAEPVAAAAARWEQWEVLRLWRPSRRKPYWWRVATSAWTSRVQVPTFGGLRHVRQIAAVPLCGALLLWCLRFTPLGARDSATTSCVDDVSSHARRLVAHRAVVARRRLLERVAAAALPAVDGPHAAFLARATAAAGAHAARRADKVRGHRHAVSRALWQGVAARQGDGANGRPQIRRIRAHAKGARCDASIVFPLCRSLSLTIVCFAFSQKQPLPKALQQKGKQKKR